MPDVILITELLYAYITMHFYGTLTKCSVL